jgi:hypothetical protein
MQQREAIATAATDAVLALPAVIAAAATLIALSSQMRITAQELPAVTNVLTILTKAAALLALGRQFSQVIALTTDGGSRQSIDPVDPWPRR